MEEISLRRVARLLLLVVLWWTFSILFNVEAKRFLAYEQNIRSPLLLSWMSLLLGSIGGLAFSNNQKEKQKETQTLSHDKQQPGEIDRQIDSPRWICLLYVIGMIATNCSVSLMSVGFVHTIKATQPLFIICMTLVGIGSLPQMQLSFGEIVSIFIVVVGVAMASFAESTFSFTGLFWGLVSNVSLSAYNVLFKSCLQNKGDKEAMFLEMSLLGAAALTPVLILFEVKHVGQLLDDKRSRQCLLNAAVAHFFFNFFSVSVLEELSVTSHAVTNVCKRIGIILASALLLKSPLTQFGSVGCLLVVFGAGTYNVLSNSKTQSLTSNLWKLFVSFLIFGGISYWLLFSGKFSWEASLLQSVNPSSNNAVRDLLQKTVWKTPRQVVEDANLSVPLLPDQWSNARLISVLQSTIIATVWPYLKNVKAVALIDFPDYNNRGDSAIWMGEKMLLQLLNISVVYECCQHSSASCKHGCDSRKLLQALRPYLQDRSGLVAMQGGGNLGDLWPNFESFRHKFVAELPNLPFLMFPQSIFFENQKNIQKSMKAYSSVRHLTLLVRDKPSLEFVREHFPDVRSALVPDMALMIGHHPRPIQPMYDIIWLSRTDKESLPQFKPSVSTEWASNVSVMVGDWLNDVPSMSNISSMDLNEVARLRTLDGFRYLAQGKILVCDRLHAHILSTMMSIPHVILDNTYRKVRNFHDTWFQDVRGTIVAQSVYEAKAEALKLLNEYNALSVL